MIGKLVSHYRILEKIGAGGMAVVYKAVDEKLGQRPVALKFLNAELEAGHENKQRFIQEAVTASGLDHNNICTIYEIGEAEGGQKFIAMAYCGGGNLKERLDRGALPPDQAVETAIQIAQGLAKAHEHGIIHRDLKPANVMFNADGVVKIVDFGLARLSDSRKLSLAARLTPTGAIMGTPNYMSPEQAKQIEVDQRTDIWSLGVVLYEMLSTKLPFDGEDYLTVLEKIARHEPQPLKARQPTLPALLIQIVARALQKSVEARYPSMHELLHDLCELKAELSPSVSSQVVALPRDAVLPDFPQRLQRLIEPTLVLPEATRPPAGNNPYLNRVKVQNPRDFYGRSSDLSRIYERIKAGRPQSVSIVGVRRIGKSSLLSALHHPANRRKFLPAPLEYIMVFLDFQEKRKAEPAELLRYIFAALHNEFHGRLKLNVEPEYEGLKEVVQALQEGGFKLIFLWDEFESVTKNSRIGPEFYAYFRALANNFNVAYITTSSAQLQSLCHTKEIADSPFFNIFTNSHLGPFTLEEAKELIVKPSAEAGKPLAAHADFVIEIAGRFPIFIQMACSALFSLGRIEKAAYKKAKEAFLEEARPHFQEYWERFDESQKAVVDALARGKKPPREHAFAMKDLAQAGFVLNDKLFSTVFAEFVRETGRGSAPWWQLW